MSKDRNLSHHHDAEFQIHCEGSGTRLFVAAAKRAMSDILAHGFVLLLLRSASNRMTISRSKAHYFCLTGVTQHITFDHDSFVPPQMKNPPHPGGFVLRECIEPLELTITDAAAALQVTRTTLSELVNGRRGISPDMAVRLSKVFGGSAQSWLVQQAQYDLAQIKTGHLKLKRLALA